MDSLAEALEKLETLRAYLSHDLRSQIGAVQTTLSLYGESPQYPPPEIIELLLQSYDRIKECIGEADRLNEFSKMEENIIWILSDRKDWPEKSLFEGCLLIRMGSPEEVEKRAKNYAPTCFILDLDTTNSPSALKSIRPLRVPCYSLSSAGLALDEALKEAGVREHWELQDYKELQKKILQARDPQDRSH